MLSLTISPVNTCRERTNMASRSSSSRGRGKGRGKEIINFESGSFTQKLSGSSTQPQSSSQSDKQTNKQTKADYAFPIQTLLAFQEQGLTNLPKKTWASIAEDSDQDLPSLDLMIQQQKTQIVQSNPRPIQILAQNKQEYFQKSISRFITTIEPEFWDKITNRIPSKIFPSNFHFEPITPNKTQIFYEFILVDTDSVAIKHFRDPKDDSIITHSTLQILKVLSPSDFGTSPNQTRKFSATFDPIGFNYWDYIRAWDNTILGLQNKHFKHSWLIYFKKSTKYTFPNWFHNWWNFFGPSPQIFPPEVLEGFQLFSKRFDKDLNNYPIDLNFFTIFSLSWIFSWQYKILSNPNSSTIPDLHKQASIKWWTRFDASMASPDSITMWFKNNPKSLQAADPETCILLNQKAHIAATLASSSTEDDVLRNLENIVQLLKKEKDDKKASSSSSSPQKRKTKKKQIISSPSSESITTEEFEDEDFDDFPIDLC